MMKELIKDNSEREKKKKALQKAGAEREKRLQAENSKLQRENITLKG